MSNGSCGRFTDDIMVILVADLNINMISFNKNTLAQLSYLAAYQNLNK